MLQVAARNHLPRCKISSDSPCCEPSCCSWRFPAEYGIRCLPPAVRNRNCANTLRPQASWRSQFAQALQSPWCEATTGAAPHQGSDGLSQQVSRFEDYHNERHAIPLPVKTNSPLKQNLMIPSSRSQRRRSPSFGRDRKFQDFGGSGSRVAPARWVFRVGNAAKTAGSSTRKTAPPFCPL